MKKNEQPLVGIVIGSDSDLPVMQELFDKLDSLGIPYEAKILSAHRTPKPAAKYAETAIKRGLKVLAAAAGHAAHLAGSLAAHTILPVIAVPIDSSCLQGMDALLSTVQMPPGIPVATMAIGKSGAYNAAIMVAQILALNDEELAIRLTKDKKKMEKGVLKGKQAKLDKFMETRKKNNPEKKKGV